MPLIKKALCLYITLFPILASAELRIASLAPHITELVYFAGAEEMLIAVDRFSNYPEQTKTKKVLGDVFNINTELLLAERINTVLYWQEGTPKKQLVDLEKQTLILIPISIQKLEDIPKAMQKISQLTGTKIEGKIQKIEEQISKLTTKRATKPVSVFYQISAQPIYTVNGQHLISDVVQRCGGKNIFAEENLISPVVSLESVLSSGAELIIRSEEYKYDNRWQLLPAVKRQQYLTIDADILSRPSPRFIQAAEKICSKITQLATIPAP